MCISDIGMVIGRKRGWGSKGAGGFGPTLAVPSVMATGGSQTRLNKRSAQLPATALMSVQNQMLGVPTP